MSTDNATPVARNFRHFIGKSTCPTAAATLFLRSVIVLCSLTGLSAAGADVPLKFETNDNGMTDLETAPGVLTNSATLPCPDGDSLTMTISIVEPNPGLADMRIISSGTAGLGVAKSGVTGDIPTQLDTGEAFEVTFDKDVWVTEIELETFWFAKESDSSTQNDEIDITIGGETLHYVATTDYMGGIPHEPIDLSLFSSLSLSAGQSILISPAAAGQLSTDGISHIRLHSISVHKHIVPEPSAVWLLGMGIILPLNNLRRRQKRQ